MDNCQKFAICDAELSSSESCCFLNNVKELSACGSSSVLTLGHVSIVDPLCLSCSIEPGSIHTSSSISYHDSEDRAPLGSAKVNWNDGLLTHISRKLHVVGWSLGGMVATHLTLRLIEEIDNVSADGGCGDLSLTLLTLASSSAGVFILYFLVFMLIIYVLRIVCSVRKNLSHKVIGQLCLYL